MSFKIVDDQGNEITGQEIKQYLDRDRSKEKVADELYYMLDGIISAHLNKDEGAVDELIKKADIRIDEMIKNREI